VGPIGYDLARRLNDAGVFVFSSTLSNPCAARASGEDRSARRRGAGELLRAGELVEVKLPERQTEAIPNLERAGDDAKNAERAAHRQLDKILLRHSRTCSQGRKWTQKHWRWIGQQEFNSRPYAE